MASFMEENQRSSRGASPAVNYQKKAAGSENRILSSIKCNEMNGSPTNDQSAYSGGTGSPRNHLNLSSKSDEEYLFSNAHALESNSNIKASPTFGVGATDTRLALQFIPLSPSSSSVLVPLATNSVLSPESRFARNAYAAQGDREGGVASADSNQNQIQNASDLDLDVTASPIVPQQLNLFDDSTGSPLAIAREDEEEAARADWGNNNGDSEEEQEEETDEERVAREMAESERLAWGMMQQEANDAYEQQMQAMREMQASGALSQEDFNMLEATLAETVPREPAPAMPRRRRVRRAAPAAEGGEGGDGVVGAESGEESGEGDASDQSAADSDTSHNSSGWRDPNNYDQLLALSAQIGDVKTERWRARAPGVISALPTISYREILRISQPAILPEKAKGTGTEGADTAAALCTLGGICSSHSRCHQKEKGSEVDHSRAESPNPKPLKAQRLCLRTIDATCSVCMAPYEESEELALLPCDHYFHQECAQGWMADNNSCPTCKSQVASTP